MQAAGKIKLPDNLREWIERGGLSESQISMARSDLAGRLPAIHRDPFDRMLVAQALG
jgi:PIN domain nuclease of toxin-antitoxin system